MTEDQFNRIKVKTKFAGLSATPWMLLPLRLNTADSLVYPVWFYPDTGSWNTFLTEHTMEVLGLKEEGLIYLLGSASAVKYDQSTGHWDNVNLLGRNFLFRGMFSVNQHQNKIELSEIKPKLAPPFHDL